MKQLLSLAILAFLFATCTKNQPVNNIQTAAGVTEEIKAKVAALGFSTDEIIEEGDGFIVEGDIYLSRADLNATNVDIQSLNVGESEQYNTTNLVTGLPRVITISRSGNINANVNAAIDGCIARYNAANLQITFQAVASGGAINFTIVNGGSYIASSGFPTGGNPYNEVKFNKQYQNWNLNTLISVMTHEVGHCIGFRHTDYMDRSYSCGGSPTNEGASSVGAILIPGTPAGPDPNSWMLACIGNGVNRPFNANDVTALNYLY